MSNDKYLDGWEEPDVIETPPPPVHPEGIAKLPVGCLESKLASTSKIRILKRTTNGSVLPPAEQPANSALNASKKPIEDIDADYEKCREQLQKSMNSNLSDPELFIPDKDEDFGSRRALEDPDYRRTSIQTTTYYPSANPYGFFPRDAATNSEFWNGKQSTDVFGNTMATFPTFYPPLYPPPANVQTNQSPPHVTEAAQPSTSFAPLPFLCPPPPNRANHNNSVKSKKG